MSFRAKSRNLLLILLFPLLAAFTPPSGPTERGNDAYSAGRYDDALSEYKKAVDEAPNRAEAHYNLGGAYYKKGDYEDALKDYGEAARLDPKMADALYNAGDCYYRLGRYDEALKAFQEADRLRQADKDTEHNLTLTLKKLKLQEKEKKQGQNSTTGTQGQQKPGQQGNRQPGQGAQAGQGPQTGQPQPGGGPQMSNEEVQAMLNRQAKEEKALRNYFRPGRKGQTDREAQIEQILRGAGLTSPSARAVRPGAPYVEKDW